MPLIKRAEIIDDRITGLIDRILKEKDLNKEKLQYVDETIKEIDKKVLEKAREKGLPLDFFVPLKTVVEEGVPSFTSIDNISIHVDRRTKPKLPSKVILPSLSGEIMDLAKIKEKYGAEVANEIEKILTSIEKIEEAKNSISVQYSELQKELARILSPIETTLSNYSNYTKRLIQYLFWLLNKYQIKAVRKDGLIYALRSVLESTGRIQREKVVEFLKLFAKILQREYGISVNLERLIRELMGNKLSVELARIKDIGEAAVEKIEEALEKLYEQREKEHQKKSSANCPLVFVAPASIGLMFHKRASELVTKVDLALLSAAASLEYAILFEDFLKGALVDPSGLSKIAAEEPQPPEQPPQQQPAQPQEQQQPEGAPQPQQEQTSEPEKEKEAPKEFELAAEDVEYLSSLFKASLYVLATASFIFELARSLTGDGSSDKYLEVLSEKFKRDTKAPLTLSEAMNKIFESLSETEKNKLKEIADNLNDRIISEKWQPFFRNFADVVPSGVLKLFSSFLHRNYDCPRTHLGWSNYVDVVKYLNAESYDIKKIIDAFESAVPTSALVKLDISTKAIGGKVLERVTEIVEKPQRSMDVKTRTRFKAKAEKFMTTKKVDGRTVTYIDKRKVTFFIPRSFVTLALPCLDIAREFNIEITSRDLAEAAENIRAFSSLMSDIVFEHVKEYASAAAKGEEGKKEKVTNIYGPKLMELYYNPGGEEEGKKKKKRKEETENEVTLRPIVTKNMKLEDMQQSILHMLEDIRSDLTVQRSIKLWMDAVASGEVAVGGKCSEALDTLIESFGGDIDALAEKFIGGLVDRVAEVLRNNAKTIGIEAKKHLKSFDIIYSPTNNPYLEGLESNLKVKKELITKLDPSLAVGEVKKDLSVIIQRYVEFAIASLFGYDSRENVDLIALKFIGPDGFEYSASYFRPIAVRLATFFTSLSVALPDEDVNELIEKAKNTLSQLSEIVYNTLSMNKSIVEASGTITFVGSANRQHLGSLLAAIIITYAALKAMRVTYNVDLPLKELSLNTSLRPIIEDKPEEGPKKPEERPTEPKGPEGPTEPKAPEEKPAESPKPEPAPSFSIIENLNNPSSIINFVKTTLESGTTGIIAESPTGKTEVRVPLTQEISPEKKVSIRLIDNSKLEVRLSSGETSTCTIGGELNETTVFLYLRVKRKNDKESILRVRLDKSTDFKEVATDVLAFSIAVEECTTEVKPQEPQITPEEIAKRKEEEERMARTSLVQQATDMLQRGTHAWVDFIKSGEKSDICLIVPIIRGVFSRCYVETARIIKVEGENAIVEIYAPECPTHKYHIRYKCYCPVKLSLEEAYLVVGEFGNLKLIPVTENVKIKDIKGIGFKLGPCSMSNEQYLEEIFYQLNLAINNYTTVYLFEYNGKLRVVVPFSAPNFIAVKTGSKCSGVIKPASEEGIVEVAIQECNLKLPPVVKAKLPKSRGELVIIEGTKFVIGKFDEIEKKGNCIGVVLDVITEQR